MRYIITEDQYEFLNHAVRPRLDKMEEFGSIVQEMIDDNIESILSEMNLDGFDPIIDVIIYDIKLGYGDRVYDLKIYAVVDEKYGGYWTNDDGLKYYIIKFIKEKFGIKCGVDIKLAITD